VSDIVAGIRNEEGGSLAGIDRGRIQRLTAL